MDTDTQTLSYEQQLAVFAATNVWTRDIERDDRSLQEIVQSENGNSLADALEGVGLGLEIAHNAISGDDHNIFDGVYLVDYQSDDSEGDDYYLALIPSLDELTEVLLDNVYFTNDGDFERHIQLPNPSQQQLALANAVI